MNLGPLFYPFIVCLVLFVIGFGFFINFVMRKLNGKIRQRPFSLVEGLLIAGIILGVVGLFQPFAMVFYTYGFSLVLFSTLAFTVWSHVVPRTRPQ